MGDSCGEYVVVIARMVMVGVVVAMASVVVLCMMLFNFFGTLTLCYNISCIFYYFISYS